MRYFFIKRIDKIYTAVLYFFSKKRFNEGGIFNMTLYEEIFFEFNLTGIKADIIQFMNYIKSGELDDILEITSDHIFYDDDYDQAEMYQECHAVITNEEYGIEMDELDTDELLDELCKAGRKIDIRGTIYDIDNEEYQFISEAGNNYYINARDVRFNEDPLDD